LLRVPSTGKEHTTAAVREPTSAEQTKPKRWRRRILVIVAVLAVLLGGGLLVAIYYVDSVPTPSELELPESTTVYYADGRTPMAKLGAENRTIVRRPTPGRLDDYAAVCPGGG
jgi:hypothetical protein